SVKKSINDRDRESPISIPRHVLDDLSTSTEAPDAEERFYLWENDPLKRSVKSSKKPLEGTPESHVAEVSQDPTMLPVQRRNLDPLPKKYRHHKKATRTKRRRKEKMEAKCPPVPPTPSTPPQSEEDEAVDKKPTLLSAQEDNPDLLHDVGVAKSWDCHSSIGKIITVSAGRGFQCDASGMSDRVLRALSGSETQALFSCSDILSITTTLLWQFPKLCLSDLLKV
ncbi:hypothetical protein H8959_020950, partial [Pygathrix nigripes]